ncbi:MAG: tetratricopeptide repeat protein [Rhodobacteraceae bacterium]|nr:tetratricopeptide repeat protein [Paracoccaceae bacterium]
MKALGPQIKRFVASFLLAAAFPLALTAQGLAEQADIEELYDRLQDPELSNWEGVEDDIWAAWARSGSESIDLLLRRGQDALEEEDNEAAIEHFTAAIDHAPDFAEAYNGRATAFFQMERYGQSLADIEMVLALNPRHFGALTGLALILEALDQPEDALSAYRAVAAIHPHRPNVKDAIERLEAKLEGRAI